MPAQDRILEELAAAGGWISFARYMQLALHEPGIGYYASGARKFGPQGDFVTAPELGSLFGRTLARELRSFDRILERGVDSRLGWADRPATGELLTTARRIDVPAPYVSEIGLAGRAWMRTLAQLLERGAIFVIDYGFPAREYYHPQRASGTLMCHYRHRAHADPFARPGEEDITAHVDFSALAAAATEAGAQVLGYTTQAQFLINCGITDVLGEANVQNALHYAPLAAEAQRLLSPAEMGELFKVLVVGTPDCPPLLGFGHGDRRAAL